MTRWITSAMFVILMTAPSALGQGEAEVTGRIIEEGRDQSKVWDYLVYLSDEIGPRLTGSSAEARAHAWTRDEFVTFGLDSRLEKWGDIPVRFDRGPSTARMVEPTEREFEFTSRAWSAGTDGPVRGHVIKTPTTMSELEGMRDHLEGAWVLSKQRRWQRRRRGGDADDEAAQKRREAAKLREEINTALREAGIAGRIYGGRSDLVTTGAVRGWRELSFDDLPTEVGVYVRRIDYDAMNSRLADGEEVVVEVDLQHHFVEGPFPVFNVVAEIPGTERPEEVVIISGHLDSWDGPGTRAAQDNGTGCAVVLEAARILAAIDAKPKRTIRFILWSGEEQGLLGSRGYLESLTDEEKAGISAVFVEDGGTNYEGGLLCIGSMVPMLEEATAPVAAAFPDMPVKLVVREKMPRGGGSDHSPFNRAGIPGFFWQEHGIGGREGKNYRFIHHTQHDLVRYAVPEYLVQSAVCSAVTVYNLAMADDLLPRQPMETEEPRVARRSPTEAPSAAEDPTFTVADGPLSGEWKGRLVGEDAPPDSGFTITFEMSDDDRVRGHMVSQLGEGRIRRASFDAETKKLTFIRETEQMGPIHFEATVEGDAMSGTLTINDEFTMPFKAERTAAKTDVAAADPPPAAAPN